MDDSDDVIAQVALEDTPCDLCNKYIDVGWWCLECEELLCDNCKKIHLKSKASQSHQVIHKDEKSEMNDKKVNYIYCCEHDSIFNMFCKDCQIPVCTDCVVGSHNTHKLDKIENTVQQQKTEITTLIKHIHDNKEVTLKNRITKGITYMKEIEIKQKTLKQASDKTNETIHQDFDNTLIQECDYVTKQLLQAENDLRSLQEDIKDCEENMPVIGVKFLLLFTTLKERLKKHTLSTYQDPDLHSSTSSFNTSTANFTELFLRKLICRLNEVKLKVILPGDISDSFGTITDKCIAPTISSGHIWVGNEDEKTIAILTREGTLVRSIKVKRSFDSLVIGKTGHLLCSYWGHSVLKELSNNHLRDFKHDKISPYNIKCVYRTDNGELLCGVTSDLEGSKVILLSESGSIEKTYQYSSVDNSDLFDDPYCLIQNKNKDIWMVECENTPVKVVNDECRLKFKYSGIPSTTNIKFNALGLECDILGRVLISDKYNHCIHLLDEDGQFLQYITTKDDGILYPTTIKRDKDQNIWVLSEHGRKLYLISYMSKVMTLHVESYDK